MSKLKGMFREFDQFNFDLIKDLSELIFNESHKKKNSRDCNCPLYVKMFSQGMKEIVNSIFMESQGYS